ncbi:hypothetical protein [Wielerella bovis]|uniref:hypothetical protein n=1 Tax=Wielerella bovis TaxID=2917790 RepID=UPI002018BA4C|nr:hypothetical protein [Wielerella bovis]MCG7655937.1 hypothetical protein [Wielerella bovis]MCG7655961.1 hypothetical protein [Wielerella bovis]MCG7658146.1 hypothetical protein [Wielerella bovis]MCG7658184.1 hypothetical protein [Wielerella bovis]
MTVTKIKLSSNSALAFQDQDGKRRFSGIANSGKPFGYGTYQTVVDFDGIQIKPQTAVLIEHNPHKACGVATLSVDKLVGSLKAEGVLMNNEHGKYIAELADDGFPWEMSIYVQSARYEELSAGATAVVNGNTVTGPCVIMRDCAVREVSFTPVGVDSQTQAIVLSDGSSPNFTFSQSTQNKENTMTPEEQAQFDALTKENSDLKTEIAELKKANKKADVEKKLSAANVDLQTISAPMMTALLSASESDADAMIADLGVKLSQAQGKPPLPAGLMTGLEHTPPADGVKLSQSLADLARERAKQGK